MLRYDINESNRRKHEEPNRKEAEFEANDDETAKLRRTEKEANGHPGASSNLPVFEERTNIRLFREVE